MAMETNTTSMPTGIRPVERSRDGGQVSGIQRRGADSSAAFAPRTNVSLQSSIADMAGILSKISSEQDNSMEKMSPELQKLIDKLMQQSFSLESTLAEGLGSTLSNQRFAVDQMLTLARMFSQMGMLSEQGMSTELNEKLQTLLTNFKEHMTEGEGKALEPAMLHKLAFQMLEASEAEELPENLQYLLMQQGIANPQPQNASPSESLGFMKQLMQYFMPTPQAEESYSEPQPQQTGQPQQGVPFQQNTQPQQTGQPQQGVPFQQNTQPQQTGQPQQGVPFQQTAQPQQTGQSQQGVPFQQTAQPQQTGQPQQGVPFQQNTQPQQTGQPQQGVPFQQIAQPQQTGQPQQGVPFQQTAQPQQTGQPQQGVPFQQTAQPQQTGQPQQGVPFQQTAQPQQTGQPQQGVPFQQNTQPQQTGQPQQGVPFQQIAQPQQTGQPQQGVPFQQTAQSQQTGQPQQGVPFQQTAQSQQTGQPQQGVPFQQTAQPQQTGQPQQGVPFQQTAQSQQTGQSQQGVKNSFQQTLAGLNERIQQNSQSTQQSLSTQQSASAQQSRSLQQPILQQQLTKSGMMSQNTAARTIMQLPMQNTPQAMETMRQMASLLLKDATLTEQDTKLLSDFVNNQQGILSEKEAKELQLLLQLCEKNVPASVRQLAQRQGMENLPRLWAFMELCDVATLKERDAKSLKKAGKNLSDFASMMKHSMGAENARTAEGHRSMSFMTPLYMGEDQQKPYPAYIHVYDEEKKEDGNPSQKETWLRICLLTENIGAVDVSFRMYEGTNVDVRIFFSERENIAEFREYMDEFRASFDDKPLTLKDVKLGVAGAKS